MNGVQQTCGANDFQMLANDFDKVSTKSESSAVSNHQRIMNIKPEKLEWIKDK